MEKLKERTTAEMIEQWYEDDGYVYDKDGNLMHPSDKPQFAITDESSALWFSEKICGFDATILAEKIRMEAIAENCKQMIADVERAKSGMLWKYGEQLKAYAKANLPHGKKTYTNPYLKVMFRTTKDRVTITDKELALKWARDYKVPSAIKTTEEVQIGLISDQVKNEMLSGALQIEGFEVKRGGETAKIETGVE